MVAAPEALPGVGATLVEQGMPIEEVQLVLRSDDPVIVRRHLELHRERLAERSDEQRREADRLEVLLAPIGAIEVT